MTWRRPTLRRPGQLDSYELGAPAILANEVKVLTNAEQVSTVELSAPKYISWGTAGYRGKPRGCLHRLSKNERTFRVPYSHVSDDCVTGIGYRSGNLEKGGWRGARC
jgi:hypothetical protein